MDKKIRKYTIIISILLHVLFFFVAERTVNFRLLGTGDIPEVPNDPIVFDLGDTEKPRQVIETIEGQRSDKRSERPEFLSDKNTMARNSEAGENLKQGKPFMAGDLDVPSLPELSREGKPDNRDVNKNEKTDEVREELKPDPDTISETEKKVPDLMTDAPGGTINNQILYKNILSKVNEVGGFAFNTYDWDFAPYMLELKRRIQSNIFPPIAFSQLGLIDGETLLRFRIYPDGRLENLELLNYKGHKSLMDTSMDAVGISAPFPELPEDFPEPFLEVTGKFIYFIRR